MPDEQWKECPTCEGTGSLMPEGCEHCDNNGWVDDPADGGTMTCPECMGEVDDDCPDCEGEGLVDDKGYAKSYSASTEQKP